jgi:hypothetical protein
MERNYGSTVTYSIGVPAVVLGVLIALKKVGMTTMGWSDIIWFTIEVWIVCAVIAICIWAILMFIIALFSN